MRRGLRKRYGRTMGPQAITRPAGGGLVDVVLVDSKGTVVRTLHRKVPYGVARQIIRRA